MQIKYRIGVMPGPWPSEGRDFFWRFVELCEKSEIDSLWFSERLSSPLPIPEPMTAMAAIAARTTRLKFGPSVFVTPFRTPALAAREIAMVDYLSGGRLLPAFGIGVDQPREFLAAGVPFRERGRRTDEAIAIMRRCWTEDEVTFGGAFWQLDRITVLPRPVQKPLELWIGGNSEPAMRRAGRLGDGWIPSFITPEQFRVGVDKTQAFAAEAGRRVPDDHFGVLFYCCIDPDPGAARAVHPPRSHRRRRAGALHGVRSGRGGTRAPGGVHRGRRLEVHRPPDVPAGADARSARTARQRRHSRRASPLSGAPGLARPGRGAQPERRMSISS